MSERKSTKERKRAQRAQKGAKGCKRAQESSKGRKRALPCKKSKQPGFSAKSLVILSKAKFGLHSAKTDSLLQLLKKYWHFQFSP